LPTKEGVYQFIDENGEVLYVGKAKNLRKRVSSYFQHKDLGAKTRALVDRIEKIRTINTDSELESLILEANLIKKYSPRYNARLTDGKTFYQTKITVKDDIPKVLLARRENDGKSVYFGPFPNSSDLKMVLKIIRRIFPYQSVENHAKRYCLYYHLNLCPCPPMFKTKEDLKEYRTNIRHIIQFFNGETKKIIKELEKERDEHSKEENFEKALEIQKKIDAVVLVTTQRRSPFEYEQNPNLRSDIRSDETSELLKVLQSKGIKIEKLNRIECYDISNITGKFAVGSMVVFTNGERDSSEYRRFQIKRPPKVVPNDFAMMREVVKRRFNHEEWPFPDLLIVDGGKGQISSVNKGLFEMNIEVPVIGIAKREELLITSTFEVIRLPRNSKALMLVRRIRDEAHRFAITYHRKLRSKYLTKSLR
jgi:excinuclease ABC subunit C